MDISISFLRDPYRAGVLHRTDDESLLPNYPDSLFLSSFVLH